VILKIGLKIGHESTLEKLMNKRKEGPEQKFDAALGTIFGICKYFQRSKQKLYTQLFFS
jgi:hypothetical protein